MAKVQATYSEIWKISYPIILGSLAQTILGLTDTAFLSRVGEVELGASAIAGVFYFVLAMIGGAVGVGAQILIARKAGEGNNKEIGKIYDHTLLLLLALSFLLFFVLRFLSPFIFSAFLHSENVRTAANEFIAYRSWGIIFVMIAISFRSFYVGIATTRIITYSAFLMTGLNVVLAYAMIFGHWGFPAMGIGGAALASSISEAVAAIYLLIYSFLKNEFQFYHLLKFEKIEFTVFSTLMNLSSPIMLQHFFSMGAWFLFFVFIEKMGEHPLAISNIVRTTYMLLMTPIWGYAAAANSMTSNLIGQKKSNDVIALLKKIITLSLATTAFMMLINVLFPSFILSITTSDDQLIQDSLASFFVMCGAMMFLSVSAVLFSGVTGTGNTKIALILEFVNIVIYLLYVYLSVIILKTSVERVWIAEIIYWMLMGVFSFIYLRSNHWKKLIL